MYQPSARQPVTPRGTASCDGENGEHGSGDARPLVVALVLDRVAQARMKGLVTRSEDLMIITTVEELRDISRTRTRGMTIISEARDAQGRPTSPLLGEIRHRCPRVALIGYRTAKTPSSDVLALANAGIDELVQQGVDDEGRALRAALRGSIESCAARQIVSAIEDVIPPALMPVVQYCLRYPREDHSVAGLALAQGLDRKTLLNYSKRTRFPPPSALAMWCRLMLAAALIEATREPVEHISNALEFASPSSFRNACRRYTKLRPSRFQQPGGLALVVGAFRRDVSERRTTAASP